ncbi:MULTISPECIES: response regulator transcription factor [Pontibacillus]|uniref:Response regulator transcription factor n=1 Tax=Pontibacillus chungwhensis TaxID=265426 RepID=A0ABY8UTN2_9BACI|nr:MULTISPECIES: response regulator transcription factor [Pontibacillus]MCD5323314.1 response regulator transcription factor [Pontibacillus sp. HN14]WIF96695.1 response regulator transcription factor [Pontibacillus chungwhensis]
MEKILIVDDEPDITAILADVLSDEGYVVTQIHDGREAIQSILETSFDLVLLDVMMPGVDGLTVCREVRYRSEVPILFLTAKSGIPNQIQGLNEGADDYIEKPFSNEQVVARVKAHLRREKRYQKSSQTKTYKSLVMDVSTYEAYYKQTILPLTKREFDIVRVLIDFPGQVFSRDQLYERVWGLEADGDASTITEHIRNIRAKVKRIDTQAHLLQTVWGVGYRIG